MPALLGLALLGLGQGCKHDEEPEEAAEEPVVAVRVAKVERQDLSTAASAVGSVAAKTEASVSSKVGGSIAQMELLKDREVKAGEVLATLESADLEAAAAEADAGVEEAEAALQQMVKGTIPQSNAQARKALHDAQASVQNAEALYKRRLALFDEGGIAKKELEDAELALQTARNDLALARQEAQLKASSVNPADEQMARKRLEEARQRAANARAQTSYAVVRSPIDGVVSEQFHTKGDYIAAGDKLVTVMDLHEVVVKAQFPDTVARLVQKGAEADVELSDTPGDHLLGMVSLVSRTIDPTSRTVEIWVEASNEGLRLRPGAIAKVSVTTASAKGTLAVPPSAVIFEDPSSQEGKVMVVDAESVAHEVPVTTGIRTPEAIQVVSGLQAGQTVITEGNYALPDATKVRVTGGAGDEAPEERASADADEGAKADEGGAADKGAADEVATGGKP